MEEVKNKKVGYRIIGYSLIGIGAVSIIVKNNFPNFYKYGLISGPLWLMFNGYLIMRYRSVTTWHTFNFHRYGKQAFRYGLSTFIIGTILFLVLVYGLIDNG